MSSKNAPNQKWAAEHYDSRFTPRHFRTALCVNEVGNMSHAAAILRVTPSAVSKAISEIEDLVGAPIFYYADKIFRPTDIGDLFIKLAQRILSEDQAFRRELDFLKKGNSGLVTVGLQAVLFRPILAEVISTMIRRYRNIVMTFAEGSIATTYENVRSGRCDLAIARIIPDIKPSDLTGIPLYIQKYTIIASVSHPIFVAQEFSWPSLLSYHWILPIPGTPVRMEFDAFLAKEQYSFPAQRFESNSIASNVLSHQRDPLISLLQEEIATEYEQRGLIKIVPQNFPSLNHPVGIVESSIRKLSPQAQIFKDICIDRVKKYTRDELPLDEFFTVI